MDWKTEATVLALMREELLVFFVRVRELRVCNRFVEVKTHLLVRGNKYGVCGLLNKVLYNVKRRKKEERNRRRMEADGRKMEYSPKVVW